MKKIYLVKQDVNNEYDSYDSFIIACDNADQARNTNPEGLVYDENMEDWEFKRACWCMPNDAEVELIGATDLYNENKVILASFNAG